MENTGNYSEITLNEFLETCEIDCIDEFFNQINIESSKRMIMLSKSLTKYLSNNKQSISKYNVLKQQLLIGTM